MGELLKMGREFIPLPTMVKVLKYLVELTKRGKANLFCDNDISIIEFEYAVKTY